MAYNVISCQKVAENTQILNLLCKSGSRPQKSPKKAQKTADAAAPVETSVETSVAADVAKAVETGADVVKAVGSGADSLALSPAALDLGSVKRASKAESTDDKDVWS